MTDQTLSEGNAAALDADINSEVDVGDNYVYAGCGLSDDVYQIYPADLSYTQIGPGGNITTRIV